MLKKLNKFTSKKYLWVFLIILILGVVIVYLYCLNLPKTYIAEKYNVSKSEIHAICVVSKIHKEKKYHFDEDTYNYDIPTQWTYRLNGRTFHIEYYNKYYVDDYQLDDLWKWTVEFLQKNIDSNISGIKLYESDIFMSPKIERGMNDEHTYYNKVWKQEDVDVFLQTMQAINIYYKTDDIFNYYDSVPVGVKANNNYFALRDTLSTDISKKTNGDIGVNLHIHNEEISYKRNNLYYKNALFHYSSAYDVDKRDSRKVYN